MLQDVPGTRSAFFERVTGGYYLDFEVNREEAARYELSVNEVNDLIESAIGGMSIATTIEGRERYPDQRALRAGPARQPLQPEAGAGAYRRAALRCRSANWPASGSGPARR